MQASENQAKNLRDIDLNDNFEVALLVEDMEEAREMSDALREIGIYAHYYSDLDEFWVAANAETPDFLVMDVKKMSQGPTLFKNHPKVQNGSLAFAFYYSEDTKILVNSTFQYNHYGLIKKEISLLGQLRSALRRRNEELRLIDEKNKLEGRVERLQTRSNRILQDSQETMNFETQFNTLMSVTERIGTPKTSQEFVNGLMNVMSEWESCKAYGVYCLNQTDQKLVAPKSIKPCYEALPELWLTRPGVQGVDEYAQEMACEVAFDIFDNDARCINITGARANPEILLIARFDEKALVGFNWKLFEERLCSTFVQAKIKETAKSSNSSHSITAWEGFSYLDDIHFHQASGNHKLADVDFSRLIQVAKEKRGNRFFWNSFYGDFTAELESVLNGDFKLASFGTQSMMVFIDKAYLESDYQKLKAMVDDFQYWRYFQDTSLVMTKNMRPETRLLAPSSLNYVRQTHSNILAAGQSGIEAKPSLKRSFSPRPALDA